MKLLLDGKKAYMKGSGSTTARRALTLTLSLRRGKFRSIHILSLWERIEVRA
jgi:hypothetical protein